jgi:diguanylate cyclase (GGDEF)-like protein/PAS domain S-box-containing protein
MSIVAELTAQPADVLLTIGSTAVIASLTMPAVFNRPQASIASEPAGSDPMRELADAAVEGLVMCEDGLITDANASFANLVGIDREQLRNRTLLSVVAPEHQQTVAGVAATPCEIALVTGHGAAIPVEIVARELSADSTTRGGGSRRIYAVQDIRERKQAEARIRYLACHDPLTGLPNRLSLLEQLAERLDRAWTNDEQLAIFCLNLDRFKEINDVFGQSAGDAVLVEVTRRLQSASQAGDLVARLGGDEFAIVIDNCDPGRASSFAERMVTMLSGGFPVGDRKAGAGVSIGIAMFPSHGRTAEGLLGNADVALSRAKAQGGGSYCFYNSHMDSAMRERRALANDLAEAIAAGELELHLQPQAKVSSLAVTGFEALVRWRHRERGYVPPSEFVALAEENGLVHDLGMLVMRRACAEAARWPNPLDIAVNLSPLQFQQGDLPEQILSILVDSGLPPSRFELEITETVLITDFDRALLMLRRLKALGLRIAMDDFGTGWSSLASLQSFPFDKVKIDRTFIDKLGYHRQADVIVRAVLSLCRSLDIPVLAEGVETQEQLDFLRHEGCDELQGYLLSPPAPVGTFADLLATPGAGPSLIRVA